MYRIFKVVTGMLEENCYLLCVDNNDCIIIDPGDDFLKIKNTIAENKLNPKAILLTHGHYDHTDAIPQLKQEYDISVYMNKKDELFTKEKFSVEYEADDSESIPGFDIAVFSTPGHSKGSTCYLVNDTLFSGDTLFNGTIGRCDFEGGSFAEMQDSLKNIIMNFDDDTRVMPGHGASSTIGIEKKINPYLINLKKS